MQIMSYSYFFSFSPTFSNGKYLFHWSKANECTKPHVQTDVHPKLPTDLHWWHKVSVGAFLSCVSCNVPNHKQTTKIDIHKIRKIRWTCDSQEQGQDSIQLPLSPLISTQQEVCMKSAPVYVTQEIIEEDFLFTKSSLGLVKSFKRWCRKYYDFVHCN